VEKRSHPANAMTAITVKAASAMAIGCPRKASLQRRWLATAAPMIARSWLV
jgi:hypothetical protein